MASNWTKKSLKEISDKDFIIAVLNERLNKVNNYSFLGQKIKKVLKALDNINFIEEKEEIVEKGVNTKTIKILMHSIEYWLVDHNGEFYDNDLTECDIEYIEQSIKNDCCCGELCSCPDGVNEYRGWWKIV